VIRGERPSEQWRLNQVAVAASASGVWLGNTLVIPFLPLFVRELGIEGTGRTALWTGLLFAVSPALAALTGPVWGMIADRYGLRLVAARAAFGNSFCWFLMAFAGNIWHVLLIRTVLGLLGGFNSISVAAITQLAPRDRSARVIGNLQSTQVLSAAAGPFLGGLLYQWIGISNTFLVTALITFGSAVLIVVLYRDAGRSRRESAQPGERRRGYLHRREYLVPLLILFAIQMTDRTYTPIVPLHLEALGTPANRIASLAGVLFSAAALGEAFSAWLSGRLASKGGARRLLLLRLALGAAILAPLALAASPGAFLFWRITLALVAGGVLTLAFAAAGEVIPETERGSGYGLLSSTLMLGGSCGPVVAGLIAGISLQAVFLFNLAVYGILFVTTARYGAGAGPGVRREPPSTLQ
jgi:MFS family permease